MRVLDGIVGETYWVQELHLDPAVERRLEILGMTEDATLSVLNKKGDGSMILKIRGTRFAMGKEIAAGIWIRRTER